MDADGWLVSEGSGECAEEVEKTLHNIRTLVGLKDAQCCERDKVGEAAGNA